MQTENSHSRVALLDLARALAVLFMIQGHTLDVLLGASYRQGMVFNTWLFLRGLTAPTFFTLSGMSFTVASLKRWDSYVRFSPALVKRMRRYAFFIALGYLVHFPVKAFSDFRYLDLAGWQGFFQSDVLQCVGLTLITLQLLVWVAKTPQRFAGAALAFCGAVVLLTPTFANIDWGWHIPMFFVPLLSGRTGSFFPLFPWSGFIFLGSGAGYGYARWWSNHSRMRRQTLAAGAAVALVGLAISRIPLIMQRQSEHWFLIRVGCVCCLLALLSAATQRVRTSHPVIASLARESLVVYLIHACILYGSLWNTGLRQLVGPHLTPLQCLGWIGTLILSMVALACTWNWYKRNESQQIRVARFAMFFLAVLYAVS